MALNPGRNRLLLLMSMITILGFLTNPLFFEFLFGSIAATIFSTLEKKQFPIRDYFAWALVPAGVVLSLVSSELGQRWWAWGIPATMIVFGLANTSKSVFPSVATTLGQVSYPFYLFQWLTLPISARLFETTNLYEQAFVFSATLFFSYWPSWAIYKFFDLPVRNWTLRKGGF